MRCLIYQTCFAWICKTICSIKHSQVRSIKHFQLGFVKQRQLGNIKHSLLHNSLSTWGNHISFVLFHKHSQVRSIKRSLLGNIKHSLSHATMSTKDNHINTPKLFHNTLETCIYKTISPLFHQTLSQLCSIKHSLPFVPSNTLSTLLHQTLSSQLN